MKQFDRYLDLVEEEIELPPGGEDLFDPDNKADVETNTFDVEQILPGMDENGKRYFELMVEGTYGELVDKIKRYTGVQAPDRMAIIQALHGSLGPIQQIESRHKGHLQNLAVQLVLELEEFTYIRNIINEGHLKIDARIVTPDLQGAMDQFNDMVEQDSEKATETNLSPGEEAELSAMDILMSADKYKAAFIDFITIGESVNSWELYKMIKDKLDTIDRRLVKLYELFAVAAHVAYFMMPLFDHNGALSSAAGMASVEPGAGKEGEEGSGHEAASTYTIHAHGINFAVLIHEIVKGIYDYIGLHGKDQETLNRGDINDERLQMMAGPAIARKFKQAILDIIGTQNIQYLNPLYAKLYGPEVTGDEIKGILAKTPRSIGLVRDLFDEVKSEQDAYDQASQGEEDSNTEDWS